MSQNELTPVEVKNLIYQVRGKAVMLDRDLAELYGVETRALNQAVKRNESRFPEDFMIALNREEIMRISQTVTSLKFSKSVYSFTEQGVAMLSTVLNSERAIQVNIGIMRTFVQIRRIGLNVVDIRRKLNSMERTYDHQFKIVFDTLRKILAPEPKNKRPLGFIQHKKD